MSTEAYSSLKENLLQALAQTLRQCIEDVDNEDQDSSMKEAAKAKLEELEKGMSSLIAFFMDKRMESLDPPSLPSPGISIVRNHLPAPGSLLSLQLCRA